MAYTGSLALRLEGTEDLLCRSDKFRRKVGADGIEAARAKVYVGELLDVLAMFESGTLAVMRPCAILGVMSHSYIQIGQGSQLDLGANGAVWALFTDNAQFATDHKKSFLDFVDWTSAVMDEVAGLVGRSVENGTKALWPFSSVSMFFEPVRPDFGDRAAGDDFWLGGYVLHDNINAGGH
jgi:hypothetical protein